MAAAGRTGARTAAGLAVVLTLGLLLRLWAAHELFITNFDTATVGCMGIDILKGERPLFYYGQDYMGALEAYAAALSFAVFGVSTNALALAAIAFALAWIAAMYLLFAELYGHAGGLAAALGAAVPGWDALSFTYATYGGYPGTFFFGTLFLWLAVRLLRRPLGNAARYAHAGGMGLAAAFGVWTNFQVFSYLLTGAALVLLFAAVRRSRALLVALALAGTIGLLGLLPLLSVRAEWGAQGLRVASFSLADLSLSVKILFSLLPKLFLWPASPPTILFALPLLALAAGAYAYARSLLDPAPAEARLLRATPLLCAGIFLALYLPHAYARLGASRYLLPPFTLLAGAFFAAAVSRPGKVGRRIGWVALAVWTGFNGASAAATIAVRAPREAGVRASRETVVAAARATGARHVEVVGSELDGYMGQVFSFYARNEVRFVAAREERYQPAAEAADVDPTRAFLFRGDRRAAVHRSLSAAGVSFRTADAGTWALTFAHRPDFARRRALAPKEAAVTIEGAPESAAAALVDRNAATFLSLPEDASAKGVAVEFRLARTALVDGIVLMSATGEDLPASYRVLASSDGVAFSPVAGDFRNLLPAYTSGNQVYLDGYYPRRDLRFSPVPCRAVRVEFPGREKGRRIGEIRILERLGPEEPVADEEVAAIARKLRERKVGFAAADRWLSGRLAARLADAAGPKVFPRANPRFPRSLVSRTLQPGAGTAFIVERALADDAIAVLGAALPASCRLVREDFPHHALLGCAEAAEKPAPTPGQSVVWNGHLVLAATSPDGVSREGSR